jgi:hypothetical protein
MFNTKPKTLAHVAVFRTVVATLLTVAMFLILHLFDVADSFSAALPNMDHGGDLFVLAWCFVFLIWRLAKAWWPLLKSRQERA